MTAQGRCHGGQRDERMMHRTMLALVTGLTLTACATITPEQRVRTSLTNAGLSPRMAGCMAEQMADRLSIAQLMRLQSLASLKDNKIESLSLDQLAHKLRAMKDPEIFTVVSRAALSCAIAA